MACSWVQDCDGPWETLCGQTFEFTDGGPEDNRFRFCPYCGRELSATAYSDPGFEAFAAEESEL